MAHGDLDTLVLDLSFLAGVGSETGRVLGGSMPMVIASIMSRPYILSLPIENYEVASPRARKIIGPLGTSAHSDCASCKHYLESRSYKVLSTLQSSVQTINEYLIYDNLR